MAKVLQLPITLSVETDKSLTEENIPADAKATGEKIDELKGDIDTILTGINEVAELVGGDA